MKNKKRTMNQQKLQELKKTKCFCCRYIHINEPINLLKCQTNGHTVRNKTTALVT